MGSRRTGELVLEREREGDGVEMKVSDVSSLSDVGGPASAPEPPLWPHCLVLGDPGQ